MVCTTMVTTRRILRSRQHVIRHHRVRLLLMHLSVHLVRREIATHLVHLAQPEIPAHLAQLAQPEIPTHFVQLVQQQIPTQGRQGSRKSWLKDTPTAFHERRGSVAWAAWLKDAFHERRTACQKRQGAQGSHLSQKRQGQAARRAPKTRRAVPPNRVGEGLCLAWAATAWTLAVAWGLAAGTMMTRTMNPTMMSPEDGNNITVAGNITMMIPSIIMEGNITVTDGRLFHMPNMKHGNTTYGTTTSTTGTRPDGSADGWPMKIGGAGVAGNEATMVSGFGWRRWIDNSQSATDYGHPDRV